jgi:hypothetical protein
MAIAIAVVLVACAKAKRTEAPADSTPTDTIDGGHPAGADSGDDPVAALPPPAAELLARGENAPRALRLDETHLFWGTEVSGDCCAEVRAIPKTGGQPVTIFAAPRELYVEGADNHHARVVGLLVDRDWILVQVTENQAVGTTDGPDIHWSNSSLRVSRRDGSVEAFRPEARLDPGFAPASDPPPGAETLYFLKQPELGSKERDFFVAALPKDTWDAKVARFHPEDPLLGWIDSWAVDGSALYVAYEAYYGADDLYCIARAPIGGGSLEKLWCPESPLDQIIAGTHRLFVVEGRPPQQLWVLDNRTAVARRIARTAGNLFMAGADDRRGVVFGVEVFNSSSGNPSSELFQVDVASGIRKVIDHADASDSHVNPGMVPHTSVQFDDERVYFIRGTDIYARKR